MIFSFLGFMLKDICKTQKSLPVEISKGPIILVKDLPIQLHPGRVTAANLYINSSLYKTSIPLNIDPPKVNIINLPIVPIKNEIIDRPFNNINLQYEDLPSTKQIEDPTPSPVLEKRAARLIVIRRRKMKKHQLKKLRIRMKFEWAKRRQKRELKKEKEFQAELLGKIKEAEKFDVRAYCKEKIQKADAVLLPKRWRGKRLPAFVIKDLIQKATAKRAAKEEMALKRKSMSLKVSDYS